LSKESGCREKNISDMKKHFGIKSYKLFNLKPTIHRRGIKKSNLILKKFFLFNLVS